MATQFKGENFEFPDEKKEEVEEKEVSNEIELEIEDDTPPEDRGRKTASPPQDPTDEELSSYSKEARDRLKKFTRGYHDERRAKEAAERERLAAEDFARKVYEENRRLKEQLKLGSEVFIETTKTAVQTELDVAKKKLKDAFEAGDSDALVSAQEEISKATLRMDKAQTMRPVELEPEKEFKPAQQEIVSPRTKRWVEKNNDWFGVDEEMTMLAMGLDKKLQKKYGADYIGSDEYFQEIDQTMRKRFPEHFRSHEDDDDPSQNSSDPAENEPPRRASKPSTPVAPATRSTPPNRVKLKASQVALARKLGITPEQYAKQVALLERN